MGNQTLALGGSATNAIYHSREDLINMTNNYHLSISKLGRIYRNQPCTIHIVCVHQYRVMKQTDKSNAQAKKDFVAVGG
jgi:hypothetical protein